MSTVEQDNHQKTDSVEKGQNVETLKEPWSICLTGITHHPTFGGGDSETATDGIRGQQIIDNLREYVLKGYSVVIIDGNSSEIFKSAIQEIQDLKIHPSQHVIFQKQEGSGYGQARREGFMSAAWLSGIEAIVQVEFEKPLIDSIPALVEPIINGDADLTLSDRQIITDQPITNDPELPHENLRGLPRYQARSEAAFNKAVCEFLRKQGLLLPDEPDIDLMGNRAWRNIPEINELFLYKYSVKDKEEILHFSIVEGALEKYAAQPDKYTGPLFLPIIDFLIMRKYTYWRFVSIPTEYQHPEKQTQLENENPDYVKIRDTQRENIYIELIAYLDSLFGDSAPFERDFQG